MGHQISAGPHKICFSAGAWQVASWCERFSPRVKPKGMPDWQWIDETVGVTHCTAEAVRIANERVPFDYDEVTRLGLLDDWRGHPLDRESFEQVREFLRLAAEGGHEINGSW